MLRIIFNENGDAVNDFKALEYADQKIEEYKQKLEEAKASEMVVVETTENQEIETKNPDVKDMDVHIGTDTMRYAFLLRVIEKKIDKNEIVFIYKDKEQPFSLKTGFVSVQDSTNKYENPHNAIKEKITKLCAANMTEKGRRILGNVWKAIQDKDEE